MQSKILLLISFSYSSGAYDSAKVCSCRPRRNGYPKKKKFFSPSAFPEPKGGGFFSLVVYGANKNDKLIERVKKDKVRA